MAIQIIGGTQADLEARIEDIRELYTCNHHLFPSLASNDTSVFMKDGSTLIVSAWPNDEQTNVWLQEEPSIDVLKEYFASNPEREFISLNGLSLAQVNLLEDSYDVAVTDLKCRDTLYTSSEDLKGITRLQDINMLHGPKYMKLRNSVRKALAANLEFVALTPNDAEEIDHVIDAWYEQMSKKVAERNLEPIFEIELMKQIIRSDSPHYKCYGVKKEGKLIGVDIVEVCGKSANLRFRAHLQNSHHASEFIDLGTLIDLSNLGVMRVEWGYTAQNLSANVALILDDYKLKLGCLQDRVYNVRIREATPAEKIVHEILSKGKAIGRYVARTPYVRTPLVTCALALLLLTGYGALERHYERKEQETLQEIAELDKQIQEEMKYSAAVKKQLEYIENLRKYKEVLDKGADLADSFFDQLAAIEFPPDTPMETRELFWELQRRLSNLSYQYKSAALIVQTAKTYAEIDMPRARRQR